MRLKYQLFVILLVASATLIAALYAFNNWSFNRGFQNYIDQSQERALRSLSDRLSDGYSEHGNWEWILDNPGEWRRLAGFTQRSPDRRADAQGKEKSRPPPPPNRAADNGNREQRPPPRDGAERSRNRPLPPLILADTDKTVLMGKIRPGRTINWMPIEADGELRGYVGYLQSDRLPGELDLVFASQQNKSFALASLLMVALSAVLAALLASRIVKPVVRVSKAVGEINQGDYTQKMSSGRRDELGDLVRDVNQLAHTLEHNRTARQRWIAEISHELRTPVAILQGEIEAIEDGVRSFDETSLASLHTETLRLGRIISDLHDLSLSDIGALEYRMKPLNFPALLQERLSAAEAQCRQAGLVAQISGPVPAVMIMGDQQRMGQLIDNLLQNSQRYTDRPGRLDIRLTQTADNLRMEWADSSPGLADEDLPKLFDPLFRAEQSRNREHGGAGLGLAIVRRIVSAHQGEITAGHSPLGGLAITIDLPTL